MHRRRRTRPSGKRRAPTRPRVARRPPTRSKSGRGRINPVRDPSTAVAPASVPRWNANPEDVRRSVLKLVLTLVELIRQLMERQAIRRMENGTLTDEETESVGLALMRLQQTIQELAEQFDISPDELNLDLGPVGRLL
jgi:hypothetical protein